MSYFSRLGSLPRPDLSTYKENPFWTAEENQRFKHLGNLERFGKWKPPGPYVHTWAWSNKPDQGFQYVTRPLPKDPWLAQEEWRWAGPKAEGLHSLPKQMMPGALRGCLLAGAAFVLYNVYTRFFPSDGHYHSSRKAGDPDINYPLPMPGDLYAKHTK